MFAGLLFGVSGFGGGGGGVEFQGFYAATAEGFGPWGSLAAWGPRILGLRGLGV